MGLGFSTFECEINIDASKIQGAWDALLQKHKEVEGKYGTGTLSTLDVEFSELLDYALRVLEEDIDAKPVECLQAALEAAGFDGGINKLGALIGLTPNCDSCFRSEHEEFWDILAPFVVAGSYITFIGGDSNEILRWRFDGVERHTDVGEIIWDNENHPQTEKLIEMHKQLAPDKYLASRYLEVLLALKGGNPDPVFWKNSVDPIMEELKNLAKSLDSGSTEVQPHEGTVPKGGDG